MNVCQVIWKKGIISTLDKIVKEGFTEEVTSERSLHRQRGMFSILQRTSDCRGMKNAMVAIDMRIQTELTGRKLGPDETRDILIEKVEEDGSGKSSAITGVGHRERHVPVSLKGSHCRLRARSKRASKGSQVL